MRYAFAVTAMVLTLNSNALAATIEGAESVGGVVHFTGFIADSTCTVNGLENLFEESLDLGTYVTTDFASVGDVSTSVPLNLELTNCPDAVTGVSLRITSAEGEDTSAVGDYAISAGGATGVAIRLNDNEGNVIAYGDESKTYPVSSGAGLVTIEAQYVATAATMTPGSANLNATFALNYK